MADPVSTPTPTATPPPRTGRSEFTLKAHTQEEEDAYDYVSQRTHKFTSTFGSIAHVIKGALGAGILSGHVAYMRCGALVGVFMTIFNGCYVCLCLHILVRSGQVLYRRTRTPMMSYPEIGEAAMACFQNPKIQRFAKCFRYWIDTFISMDLFGACACYQIIIAKSLKQLVEDTHETSFEGKDGYPSLRVYLALMWLPLVLICLIRTFKVLAPFSAAANGVVFVAIIMTIYYSTENNPNMENLVLATNVYGFFEFQGMNVFAMSCIGIIVPIENNLKNPEHFDLVLVIGMSFITLSTVLISFFGYAGYLDKCESPITVNFPMTIPPKVLKALMILMIYVTHALNFWAPFNICFHYIKKKIKRRFIMWELIWRTIFVTLITTVAIIFPSVDSLLGFIGSLCLSCMAFIWPTFINLLVVWHRPGLGRFKWRLIRGIILMGLGIFVLILGTIINGVELINTFIEINT